MTKEEFDNLHLCENCVNNPTNKIGIAPILQCIREMRIQNNFCYQYNKKGDFAIIKKCEPYKKRENYD